MMKRSAKRKRQRATPKQPTPKQQQQQPSAEEQLRKALEPFLSIASLRYLAAYESQALQQALMRTPPPEELAALLRLMSAFFRPLPTEALTRADDAAALLMTEMSPLAQEQLRVICLDVKLHVQTIELVYQGSLQQADVRMIEVFLPAFRYNSAGVILAHNHPSGDPTLSPHDLTMTRAAIAVGKLLGVRVLDHLIIGRGRWFSLLRESPVFEEPPKLLRREDGSLDLEAPLHDLI